MKHVFVILRTQPNSSLICHLGHIPNISPKNKLNRLKNMKANYFLFASDYTKGGFLLVVSRVCTLTDLGCLQWSLVSSFYICAQLDTRGLSSKDPDDWAVTDLDHSTYIM